VQKRPKTGIGRPFSSLRCVSHEHSGKRRIVSKIEVVGLGRFEAMRTEVAARLQAQVTASTR
jgi:hypothetical protein